MSKTNDMDNSSSTQKIPKLKMPEKKLIPVVCSWCKRIYKLSQWEIDHQKQTGVSHGICPDCLKKFEDQQK